MHSAVLHLNSVHANNVSIPKDFGMVLQFLTEDGAANLFIRVVSNLQARAEICEKRTLWYQKKVSSLS